MVSVVIPVFNESENIVQMIEEVKKSLYRENIENEIVIIDDGSSDSTWEVIKDIASKDSTIHGVGFTRNFGKESAIFAGLKESRGDAVVVIDGDLQHPPEMIIEMYHLWEKGFDIIEGRKKETNEKSLHLYFSSIFYKLISKSLRIDINRSSDFKLLDRKVVTTLINMPERNAFFRALSTWTGYKTAEVEYVVNERKAGKSKWSTWSLVKYAFTNIASFSSAPMQIVTILGIVILLSSFVLATITLIQKIRGIAMAGFSTVIIMQGFIGSITMISLGIIGYYIAKIYDEIKQRPRFLIGKRTDENKKD